MESINLLEKNNPEESLIGDIDKWVASNCIDKEIAANLIARIKNKELTYMDTLSELSKMLGNRYKVLNRLIEEDDDVSEKSIAELKKVRSKVFETMKDVMDKARNYKG